MYFYNKFLFSWVSNLWDCSKYWPDHIHIFLFYWLQHLFRGDDEHILELGKLSNIGLILLVLSSIKGSFADHVCQNRQLFLQLYSVCVCVCACARACVRAWVCVCVGGGGHKRSPVPIPHGVRCGKRRAGCYQAVLEIGSRAHTHYTHWDWHY